MTEEKEYITDNTKAVKHRWFILEPAVFLIFVATNLTAAVYQNQLLYQTCTVIFHYNETQCEPLLGVQRETDEIKKIEIEVQPYVSRILMARSLLESIIPAIVSLFIGPWSDKFGRRPVVLATFTGYVTSSIILTILCAIAGKVNLSPWLFLISSIPAVLSGGNCALITGIYCYISDVADDKTKASRMVLNEVSLCLGMMIGNISSGYVYAATNAFITFAISAALNSLALLYCFIWVVESLKSEMIDRGSKIKEFFRFELVKDLFVTCIKKRPNYDRVIIWLTLMSLTFAVFAMEGDNNVTYLFVRKQFEWTLQDYSFFSAGRIVAQVIGSVLGVYILRKLLNFSILSMTMIALTSCILESTSRAIATHGWVLYIGLALGFMRGILGPMSRAIHSFVTPPLEVGKVFALTTSLESLTPLIAAPLYTSLYSLTLSTHPGIFNCISASLYTLGFSFMVAIFVLHKCKGKSSTYENIGG
ncbi:proton-coupled folate transporter-like [Stomoxys calcitrans]|uniref:proton-coupled folate transporter-like n=1 Tax=Stomoxys calcitrans TaxID=35570 RepID=UPI0027E337A6|nr:proton-coupled folate transporter-like [Stomoxys calcitrans]